MSDPDVHVLSVSEILNAPEPACVTHGLTEGITGTTAQPLSKAATLRDMERAMAEAYLPYQAAMQIRTDAYGMSYAPQPPAFGTMDAMVLYAAFEAFLKAKRLL